jgi:hypothetical protein
MPDSALTATKEKKLTGRQYFESGRHAVVCIPDNTTFLLSQIIKLSSQGLFDALAFSYSHQSMCVLELLTCLLSSTLHEAIFSERSKHSC